MNTLFNFEIACYILVHAVVGLCIGTAVEYLVDARHRGDSRLLNWVVWICMMVLLYWLVDYIDDHNRKHSFEPIVGGISVGVMLAAFGSVYFWRHRRRARRIGEDLR